MEEQKYIEMKWYAVIPDGATEVEIRNWLTLARTLVPKNGFHGLKVVGGANLITDSELVDEEFSYGSPS